MNGNQGTPNGERTVDQFAEGEREFKERIAAARDAAADYMAEPLSPETKKTGGRLLLTSFIALAMTLGGVAPTRATALGIEFGAVDRTWLFILLGVLILYLLTAFAVRALVDRRRWWGGLVPGLKNFEIESVAGYAAAQVLFGTGKLTKSDLKVLLKGLKGDLERDSHRKKRLLVARAAVEYLAPPLAGVVSFLLCVCYAWWL